MQRKDNAAYLPGEELSEGRHGREKPGAGKRWEWREEGKLEEFVTREFFALKFLDERRGSSEPCTYVLTCPPGPIPLGPMPLPLRDLGAS